MRRSWCSQLPSRLRTGEGRGARRVFKRDLEIWGKKEHLLACLRQSGRARSDRWIWKWAENKDSLLLRRLREFRVRYALVAERLAALAEIGVDHLLGDGNLSLRFVRTSHAHEPLTADVLI